MYYKSGCYVRSNLPISFGRQTSLLGDRVVQQETELRYDTTTSLTELSVIRRFVEESVASLGGDHDTGYELALVINEAVTNILVHGYQGRPGRVRIEVRRRNGQISVCLIDWAPLFDPTTLRPANIDLPFERRRLGGLGVHMMRELSDELHYQPTPSGENQLTVSKRIRS